MARELNAKVRDVAQYNGIAMTGFNSVKDGLKNLINIRATMACQILTTGCEKKRAEKIELLKGINDRIKELLILD